MKTVKALVVVWVLLTVLPPVPCAAMQILRETYHVWTVAEGGEWFFPGGEVPVYDIMRPRPSALGEMASEHGYWRSLATRYSEGSDVFFHAEQYGTCAICVPQVPYVSAYASVVVDFTSVNQTYVEAWRSVGSYGWAEVTLTNLTDGGSWTLLSPGPYAGEEPWEVPVEMYSSMWFPFDDWDVYRLEMFAYPTQYHGSSVTVKLTVGNVIAPVVVPVPGALLLAVVGVGLLGWVRPKDDRWR